MADVHATLSYSLDEEQMTLEKTNIDGPLNGGPLNGGPLNGGPLNGGPLKGVINVTKVARCVLKLQIVSTVELNLNTE